MYKIGFITYDALPNLAKDEVDLPAMLLQHSILVEPVIWSDRNTNWNNYDLFIFRSPWDYFKRINEFQKFLDFAEDEKLKTYNSIGTIRENMDKHYLSELKKKGISVCPSVFLKKEKSIDLKEIMLLNNWETIVIKPTISGTAFHTYKVRLDDIGTFQNLFNKLKDEHTFILQPFFQEIETFGEKSLIYFNKQFSHAILKKAKQGDFRVQGEFGGTVQEYFPSPDELHYAKEIVDKIDDALLYARVDFITSNNIHYLMELELFEPSLYLINNAAKQNFATAILQICN
ncbi:MAG: glutathione synthetase [Fimbriimonadaceae bacterium]|nr:glutathione synthetase [Chitinophagales bacterium]